MKSKDNAMNSAITSKLLYGWKTREALSSLKILLCSESLFGFIGIYAKPFTL